MSVRQMAGGVARQIIKATPFKRTFIEALAGLPVSLKSSATLSLGTRLLFITQDKFELTTNLGIDGRLRIKLPNKIEFACYLFGKPSLYKGERGALFLAAHLAKACESFIDVGAHVGYFTYFIRQQLPKGPVIYAFEPNPEMVDILKSGITANKISDVQIMERAIGAVSGTVEFYLDNTCSSMGSLRDEYAKMHDIQPIRVESTTVDQFVKTFGLNENSVLKVDIENAESLFIDGAREFLKKVRYLILELLGPARQARVLERLIKDFGFNCYYIEDMILQHVVSDDDRYTADEFNWLFCRENPQALAKLLSGTKFSVI